MGGDCEYVKSYVIYVVNVNKQIMYGKQLFQVLGTATLLLVHERITAIAMHTNL